MTFRSDPRTRGVTLLGLALSVICIQLLLQRTTANAEAINDPHIAQVERGVQTAFYLSGQPRKTYSLTTRMKYYNVPAVSVAVIDNYQIVWARGYGNRDVAARAPADATTLFQAASMSKPVFAAAVLRLFQERKLDINADVNSMLRSWKVPPPTGKIVGYVTLRRILTHTAGTNVRGFTGYGRDAPIPTLVDILNGAPPANSKPVRIVEPPGGPSDYSGGGTTIGQQLAIDVAGQSFPVFMQRKLLGPLGMSKSTFLQPLPRSLWPLAATGYYVDGKPVHRGWHVYPEMAAAGLWTTASDLAKFVIAIQSALRGQAAGPITPTIAHEMTTPNTPGSHFALGPEVGAGFFRHTGGNEGFRGEFVGLVRGGRGVVIMTNSDAGLLLAPEIITSVAVAYRWPVFAPKPKASLTLGRAELIPLVGKYRSGSGSDAVTLSVRSDAKTLLLRIVGIGPESRLYAETRTRFFTLDGNVFTPAFDASGHVRSLKAAGMTFSRF